MAHPETFESVVVPYVVKAESGKLSKQGDEKRRRLSKRVGTYKHTAHRPHPKNCRRDVGHDGQELEVTETKESKGAF